MNQWGLKTSPSPPYWYPPSSSIADRNKAETNKTRTVHGRRHIPPNFLPGHVLVHRVFSETHHTRDARLLPPPRSGGVGIRR